MDLQSQMARLWGNLKGLGARRLAALGIIGAVVFLSVGAAGFLLSRPTTETLYSGLDRDDVVGIGVALREAGISFDVNAEGNTVSVAVGQAALARMTLAEKGLPHGGGVGNEIYDKLGSLGLTSFMQEVTRVRATEGELARTIQMMRGVKAARVHIVLGDEGSFRREARRPSASVVVRSDHDNTGLGQAIRHLVAAAIPNMSTDNVTVLDVDGRLLASGAESVDKAPDNLLSLERSVSQDVREAVSRALSPYLGSRNFQLSVAARLNVDKKQTNETIYNPDQRVERSVRITKENQNSQNAQSAPPSGVEANIPKPKSPSSSDSKQSSDQNQKKEELTNYEISSTAISTTKSGYSIDRLSIAMLINRAAFGAGGGTKGAAEKPAPEAVDQQVKQIEQLVASAAGVRSDRGDIVKVAVVDFVEDGHELEPVAAPTIMETIAKQSGALINAATMIVVVVLLVAFGLRPAMRLLLQAPTPVALSATADADALNELPLEFPNALPPSLEEMMAANVQNSLSTDSEAETDGFMKELLARRESSPARRVEMMIDFDEERAAMVLKQWLAEGDSA